MEKEHEESISRQPTRDWFCFIRKHHWPFIAKIIVLEDLFIFI